MFLDVRKLHAALFSEHTFLEIPSIYRLSDTKILNMSKTILIILFLSIIQFGLIAQNSVEGIYWTPDKKGQIELYEQNGKVYGRSVCCNEDKKDANNPDPELRDRSMVGIEVMSGFKKRGKKTYVGGKIYNPKDGRIYKAKELTGTNATNYPKKGSHPI